MLGTPPFHYTPPMTAPGETPTIPAFLFDDDSGQTAPLTDLRAAFLVRTGALTTLERACTLPQIDVRGVIVPAGRLPLTREQTALPVFAAGSPLPIDPQLPVLLLSARCPLPPSETWGLEPGEAIAEQITRDDDSGAGLIAACVLGADAPRAASGDVSGLAVRTLPGRHLISRPWHVRSFRDACLAYDLDVLSRGIGPTTSVPFGVTLIGELGRPGAGLFAHPTATIFPASVFDVSHGPVVLEAGAVVRPGAILIGPCSVGQGSTILERATIRPNTAIGPTCKVNGEIGGTIFQGFANKAHDGYLGDSYVGEWVNLGAGTTTSNLLNTYGEIVAKATPHARNERTGETFLGAIIGDHVKAAIGSRLMTGCVLQTGSMFATTAAIAGCVGAFTWATDTQTMPYRFEKFLAVTKAAMARRGITPSPAYSAALAQLAARSATPGGDAPA
jgi:UDP-N-acetylglucosamine diphosphorylase/glucosamine-1-phosphate N-acetyltransferase